MYSNFLHIYESFLGSGINNAALTVFKGTVWLSTGCLLLLPCSRYSLPPVRPSFTRLSILAYTLVTTWQTGIFGHQTIFQRRKWKGTWLTSAQGIPCCLESTMGWIWQRGVAKTSNMPRRNSPKRMAIPNWSCADSYPWLVQTRQEKLRAVKQNNFLSWFQACVLSNSLLVCSISAEMSTIILNCGLILWFLVLRNHKE